MFVKLLVTSVTIIVGIVPLFAQESSLVPIQNSTSLNNETTSGKLTKEEFLKKYPDMVNWYDRAVQRMKEGRNASSSDFVEARLFLDDLREHIYEFVTSPFFFLATDTALERVVEAIAPILGVVPVNEAKQLYVILKKNPELNSELFVKNSPKDLIPGVKEFDDWFFTSASHIFVEKGMDKVIENGTNMTSQ